MTVCSTAARGGLVRGMAPCPLSNRACGVIRSSPSIFTYGTARNGCGRHRGSSRATRARRDHRRAGAGAVGDAVAARGLEGFSQGHDW
jgi:hypothetical protein